MIKIRFGFADRMNNFQGQEGIGIKEGVLLTYADYFGIINYSGSDYLVAKVVEDESNNCPELVGNFIVRPATLHQYKDGSEELVLNQEENNESIMLEKRLNNPVTKEMITSKEDILEIDPSIEEGSFGADYLALGNEISATSITDEAFKKEVEEQKKISIMR